MPPTTLAASTGSLFPLRVTTRSPWTGDPHHAKINWLLNSGVNMNYYIFISLAAEFDTLVFPLTHVPLSFT